MVLVLFMVSLSWSLFMLPIWDEAARIMAGVIFGMPGMNACA